MTADSSLDLRISAIFIIFTSSSLGVALPFLHKFYDTDNKVNNNNDDDNNIMNKEESEVVKCMKTCAAGVMLGIALMHLLADAQEDLSEVQPNYNLSYAIASLGIIINLSIEQGVLIYIQSLPDSEPLSSSLPDSERVSSSSLSPTNDDAERMTTVESHEEMISHHEHENDLIKNLIKFNNLRAIITLYSMEISISVHSIIIGVGIGLLSGQENLGTLIPLIVAISFHQFVEGLGLGTNIITSQTLLSNMKIISFVIIFALTCPIGIVIGILTASQPESDVKTYAKGITNALAAGSLLYISLAEMVSNYFSSPDLIKRPLLKLMMLGSFSLGVAALAIIAIWA